MCVGKSDRLKVILAKRGEVSWGQARECERVSHTRIVDAREGERKSRVEGGMPVKVELGED